MLFARFCGVAGLPAAFGLRRRKGRLQIFDPGARIGEGLVLFGRRARQPGVLARRAIQFFLQPVARHPQLVLLLSVSLEAPSAAAENFSSRTLMRARASSALSLSASFCARSPFSPARRSARS